MALATIKQKIHSLLKEPKAGVLCHITSLPSPFSTGDLGTESRRFVDFLHEIGASVWQVLPLNMPHGDGSPYQCLSAHAGNIELICLEAVQAKGWLRESDLIQFAQRRGETKRSAIAVAYLNFMQRGNDVVKDDFSSFCRKQKHWLNDFALFMALKREFHQISWNHWPEAYKNREPSALKLARKRLAQEIIIDQFAQYIFFSQWQQLKAYANDRGVYLFGDVPIFVAYDSTEVWAQPHLFKLNEEKEMTVVAGVPPDYFSETGQRWGNPHYDWQVMQADNFKWWVSRMKTQNLMFDMVRIDHFRGFEAAWEIPAEEPTAINGQWISAPGDALLATIKKRFPKLSLIAEDLGIITNEVNALREKHHLPGMKILQFAFGGGNDNPYLPHNFGKNAVVYTGTHDNDTTLGWYLGMDENTRQQIKNYIGNDVLSMPNDLIEVVLASPASLAMIPMQDILALDSAHRMNTPGTIEGNWKWRFNWLMISDKQRYHITNLIQKYQRNRQYDRAVIRKMKAHECTLE